MDTNERTHNISKNLSDSDEGTFDITRMVRNLARCLFYGDSVKTLEQSTDMDDESINSSRSPVRSPGSLPDYHIPKRLLWSNFDTGATGLTIKGIPDSKSMSLNALKIGNIVTDLHTDDELSMHLLARLSTRVGNIFASNTSEPKFLRYNNLKLLGHYKDHPRDENDSVALSRMWTRKLVPSDSVRTDGSKLESSGISSTEACKISCVIMAPLEISDIPDECYSGFVVFFAFAGYNSRNSTLHGKEFDAEAFAIRLQEYCRQRGGFLIIVNTVASLLEDRDQEPSSTSLSKLSSSHFVPKSASQVSENEALKKWYEEVTFPISSGFFTRVCELALKVAGVSKPVEDNETEERTSNMEFLRSNLGTVRNMFEKMAEERNICKEGPPEMGHDAIESPLPESLIGDENKASAEIYSYLRSTITPGNPMSGKALEYETFLKNPSAETTDLTCMTLLTSPDLYDLRSYGFDKYGYPRVFDADTDVPIDTSSVLAAHIMKYGLIMTLRNTSAKEVLQHRLTECFLDLWKTSDAMEKMGFVGPPRAQGELSFKRKRVPESNRSNKKTCV